MKQAFWGMLIIIVSTGSLWAGGPLPEGSDNVLLNRLQLHQALATNLDALPEDEMSSAPAKSVGKAVLFSALLPGSGQFYANSYLKAAGFLAIEALAWSINISYNNQGDEKDAEFKRYADQNWSEQRYWSYLYYRLNGQEELYPDFPHGQYDSDIFIDNAGRPVINGWVAAEQVLQEFASTEYIPTFSHTLPETKTQQYYEMIGKYPAQFGNAWADADFTSFYQDFGQGNITPMNDLYATMRDEANKLYDKAAYGSMIVLLNHLVSAVDAGFTARSYNRRQMSLTYHQKVYSSGEHVNMFGLAVVF